MIKKDDQELIVRFSWKKELIACLALISLVVFLFFYLVRSNPEVPVISFRFLVPFLLFAIGPILLSGSILSKSLNRKPQIILTDKGISCAIWPFTFIPWTDIEFIELSQKALNNSKSRKTKKKFDLLNIVLKTAGKYATFPFSFRSHHSSDLRPVWLQEQTPTKGSSMDETILLSFKGLDLTERQAIDLIFQMKPGLIRQRGNKVKGKELEGLFNPTV